jgi:hypothetical protein
MRALPFTADEFIARIGATEPHEPPDKDDLMEAMETRDLERAGAMISFVRNGELFVISADNADGHGQLTIAMLVESCQWLIGTHAVQGNVSHDEIMEDATKMEVVGRIQEMIAEKYAAMTVTTESGDLHDWIPDAAFSSDVAINVIEADMVFWAKKVKKGESE